VINLIFPKYPGTLEEVLKDNSRPKKRSIESSKFRGSRLNYWPWEEAVELVGAFDYIRNAGTLNGQNTPIIIGHFGLKPANILVGIEGRLIITDFGTARIRPCYRHDEPYGSGDRYTGLRTF